MEHLNSMSALKTNLPVIKELIDKTKEAINSNKSKADRIKAILTVIDRIVREKQNENS